MYYRKALCTQQENIDRGTLQITVHSKTDNRPVENALVRISYTGDPNSIIEEVRTDSSGNTPVLQLKTPPLEYSLNASEEAQPYAEYSMQIKAEDFHQEEIAGTEVLPAVLAKLFPKTELSFLPIHFSMNIHPKYRNLKLNQYTKLAKLF